MKEKTNNLLNISYILLSISSIINLLLVLLFICLLIFVTITGINDTLAGGWLIFFSIMAGILSVPFLIWNIINIVIWFIGLLNLKKRKIVAKIFGIISIVLNLLNNLFLLFFVVIGLDDINSFSLILCVFFGINILYSFINLLLMFFSKGTNALQTT